VGLGPSSLGDRVPHHRDGALGTAKLAASYRFFVGMTRARDRLVVTWSGEPSEFLTPSREVSGIVVELVVRAAGRRLGCGAGTARSGRGVS
jgi:hypothetical protein